MYFHDQPKISLSFKTEQCCTDIQATKYCTRYTLSARSICYVRHPFASGKNDSQASIATIFNSSLQATYGYRLAQANYGTVYACPYDGSKAFTVLVFPAAENTNFSTTDYSISLLRLQQLGFHSCDLSEVNTRPTLLLESLKSRRNGLVEATVLK